MATPLTDAINALTAYANETTGASDTTLSDAVESLVAGYGGGGGDFLDPTYPSGELTTDATTIPAGLCYGRTGITKVSGPNVTSIQARAFTNAQNLQEVFFPKANFAGENHFTDCTNLKGLVLPSNKATPYQFCTRARKLEYVDTIGGPFYNQAFKDANALTLMILRNTTLCSLYTTDSFDGTPFRGYNSKTGTLYVPSALVEAYKTTGNWKTVYEAGHMTILPIEGSIYETQYADGTPIT